MLLRAFFPSTFGKEMLGVMPWSTDSPLIAYNLFFLKLICSTLLFSVRFFPKKYYLHPKEYLYKIREKIPFFIMTCFFFSSIKKRILIMLSASYPNPFPRLSLSCAVIFLGCQFPGLSLCWSRILLGCYFVEFFFF